MSETRAHERVHVEIEGVLSREEAADFNEMLLNNLSFGGCFIRTAMPEPPGAMVMLRFALPGDWGVAAIKAVGRVGWVKNGDDGPAGMGVQFVQVDDCDLDELSRYIAGLLESDLGVEQEAA